jgi:hypothetical protein
VFFGGRVAFLTFPFEPDSAVTRALESKAKCILRATIGSPIAVSQEIALAALESDSIEAEVEAIRQVLARRYRALRRALAAADPTLGATAAVQLGLLRMLELPKGWTRSGAPASCSPTSTPAWFSSPPRHLASLLLGGGGGDRGAGIEDRGWGGRGAERRFRERGGDGRRGYETGIDRIPVARSVSVRSSSAIARLDRIALAASSCSSSVTAYLARRS